MAAVDSAAAADVASLLPASETPVDPRLVALAAQISGPKNARGIPSAVFIEDIPDFLARNDVKIDEVFGELNTMHGKYKLMEQQLDEGRTRAKAKIPELEASLEALDMLERKQTAGETATSFYNLSDNVYVQAKIVPQNRVAIWMGASVMVEYSYAEGRAFLSEQLAAAVTKVTSNSEDLTFLREQIITTEVNTARAYNFNVKESRKSRLAAGAGAPLAAAGAGGK